MLTGSLKSLFLLLIYKKMRWRRSGQKLDANASLSEGENLKKFLEGNSASGREIFKMGKTFVYGFMQAFKNKVWLQNSHYICF